MKADDDDAHKMKDPIVILSFSVTRGRFRSKRFGGRGRRWGASPREPPAARQEVGLIGTRACRPSSGDRWTCGSTRPTACRRPPPCISCPAQPSPTTAPCWDPCLPTGVDSWDPPLRGTGHTGPRTPLPFSGASSRFRGTLRTPGWPTTTLQVREAICTEGGGGEGEEQEGEEASTGCRRLQSGETLLLELVSRTKGTVCRCAPGAAGPSTVTGKVPATVPDPQHGSFG